MHRSVRAIALASVLALPAFGLAISTASASHSSSEAVASVAAEAREPELILAKIHADWCPVCRSLNAPFDDAAERLADSDALVITIDKTDRDSRQAEYLFSELGIGRHWEGFSKRTGLIVLFDASTGEVVQEFSRGTTASDLVNAVNGAR